MALANDQQYHCGEALEKLVVSVIMFHCCRRRLRVSIHDCRWRLNGLNAYQTPQHQPTVSGHSSDSER
jgi:hypothetical protein